MACLFMFPGMKFIYLGVADTFLFSTAPATTYLFSEVRRLIATARHGRRPGWSGTEAGAQARPGAVPRAGSGASRLEPVEKV